MQTELVRVSSKFQVVIPQAVRERHGIQAGQHMAWVDFGGDLRLLEVKPPSAYRGIARGLADSDVANDPEI